MTDKKNANQTASTNTSAEYFTTLSIDAQRQRLIERLKQSPITTLEARHELNIMHPAGRVRELRLRGYMILTRWLDDHDPQGRRHRIARYVLMQNGVEV